MANRYERSPINCAACIEIQGTVCRICGFDFGAIYGPSGEGFIEVHHIDPVSGLDAGTIVDPAKDLIPVCSNCHSMLRREEPPLDSEVLRQRIMKTMQQSD